MRLVVPAALVATGAIVVTGSSGSAAELRPYRPAFSAHHAPHDAKPEFEPNSVLVKFKNKATASARRAAVAKLGATAKQPVTSSIVRLSGSLSAPELLKKAKADPSVELASLNYKRHTTAVPNDTYYPVVNGVGQASYLNTVRMPQAWDVSKSTGDQVIAVVDTGVDAGHPDLAGHLVAGYNVLAPATAPNDDNGHGTMTLGIIAASANNGAGVAGVGWSAKAMPVKVLDANGEGYDADVANGITWAADHGATVINLSLGGPGDDQVLHDAVKYAVAKGAVVVVAAGNDGSDAVQYPASYPEAIAVAATDATGRLTDFSSFGDWVDIAAPGWDIVSTGARSLTEPGYDPYWLCTGTSCSAPIVAGVAALVKNKWPTLTPAQVAARIESVARDAGPRGTDPYYGAGVLDAYAALGGTWAADFPGAPLSEAHDEPARARNLGDLPAGWSLSTGGTISTEGQVDWYFVRPAETRKIRITVSGTDYTADRPQNFAPVVTVYDKDLQRIGFAQNPYPTDWSTTAPLIATVDVTVNPGVSYIAVRNYNGSRVDRGYNFSVSQLGAGGTTTGAAYPVRDVVPGDLSGNAALASKPAVTFARPVDATTVDGSTVKLLNGKTLATIPATVSYDAATLKATITPAAQLVDNAPYKISVAGVHEADGSALAPVLTVFSTIDWYPSQLKTFDASGAYLAATLNWTLPEMTDFGQVVVRVAAGTKAPALDTGTLVYAGTASSVKATGLAQGTTYTFAAWIKDRDGRVGPASVTQLLGMKSGISTTSTLISYGGSVTIKGSTLRIDNLVYAGLPVNVYVRPKNSSKFTLLAALKTSSTGTLAVAHKPLVSSVYMLTFPGNADLMGTRTADITVQVAPTISATLSPSSIRLGQATAFSGYVAPAHAGQPVYLQQYGNKVWKSIASVKLSTSGKYAFGIKPAVRGQIAYRVFFPGDADHAPAYTVNKIVTIS
ncbi:S8 family serine peptidase [Kribbella sp. NPDC004875]|uniref:S8 family serine peptidase n=1 Tax=Kribbella sp. NPDC004875 TaxID=3364107 RepID=UPI00369A594C